MDNLAHSFTSVIVGSALFPKQSTLNKKRLYICSIIIANLPDIDFVLAIFGKEFYFFQHRGFTHSLLGIILLIPISLILFNKIMEPGSKKNPLFKFTLSEKIAFIVTQLLFTHFFLDYLTTYGTLFLYPFSWQRFSYPLMFIIDPLFWSISGAGAIALFNFDLKTSRNYSLLSWSCLLGILSLWLWENHAKNKAEGIYRSHMNTTGQEELWSYPGPLAPGHWLIAERFDDHKYKQGAVSFFPQENLVKFWHEPIPPLYAHNACQENLSKQATLKFDQFKNWGEHVVCRNHKRHEKQGCHCVSLKYSLIALNTFTYGSYWFSLDGTNSEFMPAEPFDKVMDYYQKFLPIPY
ncbi:MAG: metal-dependent hydrolase [Oligoflexales bacterium]